MLVYYNDHFVWRYRLKMNDYDYELNLIKYLLCAFIGWYIGYVIGNIIWYNWLC